MNGNFLIDGIDAYNTFGMIVSQGGYRDIAMFAPTKDVKISNYKEIDGVTADLSEVYLKNKNVKINFAVLADISKYREFRNAISDKSYHDFTFTDLGITERLRYISESKLDYVETFTNVTIEFTDDFPVKHHDVKNENESPVNPNIFPNGIMELNDINLTQYGIRVLGGNLNEILKNAKSKQHLTQTNALMDVSRRRNP